MPAKTEFKFDCPKCGQHILASTEWIGRQIECPSCLTKIIIPAPPREEKKPTPGVPPTKVKPPGATNSPKVSLPKPVLAQATMLESPKPSVPNPPEAATPAGAEKSKTPPAKPRITDPLGATGVPKVEIPKPSAAQASKPESPKPLLPKSTDLAVADKAKPPAEKPQASPPPTAEGPLKVKLPKPAEITAPAAGEPKILSPQLPAKPGGVAADSTRKPSPPSPPSGPIPKVTPEASASASPPTQLRIAVLTPAIKLDIVRSVRRRLASPDAWLPGKVDGKTAYAAKVQAGKNVPVDFNSPEATRFSLIGTILRELSERRVVKTATGRMTLLDEEIPDAVREAMTADLSDEERAQRESAPAEEKLTTKTHPQCLAALDLLEELYSGRMNQARAERAKQKLANVRLKDLIQKLEKKTKVTPEDVATALYHELMEVRLRLDRLESRVIPEKPNDSTNV